MFNQTPENPSSYKSEAPRTIMIKSSGCGCASLAASVIIGIAVSELLVSVGNVPRMNAALVGGLISISLTSLSLLVESKYSQ